MATCIIVSTSTQDVSIGCFFRKMDDNKFGIMSINQETSTSTFEYMLECGRMDYKQLIFVGNYWQELVETLSLTYKCHTVDNNSNAITNILQRCGDTEVYSEYINKHKAYIDAANAGGDDFLAFVTDIISSDNSNEHVKNKYYRYFTK